MSEKPMSSSREARRKAIDDAGDVTMRSYSFRNGILEVEKSDYSWKSTIHETAATEGLDPELAEPA